MALSIKPEHQQGWEHVAAKLGRTVEEHAQARLDEMGDGMERERQSDDRQKQEALFALALKLPTEKRAAHRVNILADAVEAQIITPEQAAAMQG